MMTDEILFETRSSSSCDESVVVDDGSVKEECEHLNIEEGYCTNCGMIIASKIFLSDEYSTTHVRFMCSNKLSSFEEELSSASFLDSDLRDEVLKLIQLNKKKSSQFYRKKSRKIILFTFIYWSYYRLGKEKDLNPHDLSSKIGLKSSDFMKALKIVSGISMSPMSSTFSVPMSIVPPSNYVDTAMKKLNIWTQEDSDSIKAKLDDTTEKNPSLYEEIPLNVAAALIKIHFSESGRAIYKMDKTLGITASALKQQIKALEVLLRI